MWSLFVYIKYYVKLNQMSNKTKIILNILIILFLLMSIGLAGFVYFETHKNLPVILHFSPSGIDILGSRSTIFYIPIIGVVLVITNYILFWFLKKKEPFLSRYFIFINFIISGLILISAVKYAIVNI